MSHASAADIVNVQLRAFNARDIDAFAATYSDDVCMYNMPHATIRLQGKKALVQRYGGITFKREDLRAEILSRSVMGNKVIDHEKTWGIEAGPIETLVLYEVIDGLINAVWLYDIANKSAAPSQA